MAFTYSAGASARDNVRLLLGDTDTESTKNQIFTDADIDAFLSLENGEVYAAAAAGAESIASSKARSAIMWEALDTELDLREIPKRYMALAKGWRTRAESGEPWEEIDTLDYVIGPFGRDGSEYIGDTRF